VTETDHERSQKKERNSTKKPQTEEPSSDPGSNGLGLSEANYTSLSEISGSAIANHRNSTLRE
jgi:hypothetical protein